VENVVRSALKLSIEESTDGDEHSSNTSSRVSRSSSKSGRSEKQRVRFIWFIHIV